MRLTQYLARTECFLHGIVQCQLQTGQPSVKLCMGNSFSEAREVSKGQWGLEGFLEEEEERGFESDFQRVW